MVVRLLKNTQSHVDIKYVLKKIINKRKNNIKLNVNEETRVHKTRMHTFQRMIANDTCNWKIIIVEVCMK